MGTVGGSCVNLKPDDGGGVDVGHPGSTEGIVGHSRPLKVALSN